MLYTGDDQMFSADISKKKTSPLKIGFLLLIILIFTTTINFRASDLKVNFNIIDFVIIRD